MKNEIKPITPADAGLSLTVIAGPRGSVRDDWPCIEYVCELLHSRRAVIWRGEYRLGVGHVKSEPRPFGMAQERQAIADKLHTSGKWLVPLDRVADVAAELAKAQKVSPQLNDVCHSLLMDGAAFFDGLRFEDWAGDHGYNADSIKAKETFDDCDRIGRNLSRALSRDTLAGLREWASNY